MDPAATTDPDGASDPSYGHFLANLSGHLTISICENLCLYFEATPIVHETISRSPTPGVCTLNWLKKDDIITKKDVSKLLKALRSMKIQNVADIVQIYYDSVVENDYTVPDDVFSDDEDDNGHNQPSSLTFDGLLDVLGLKGKFPGRLKLNDLSNVKATNSLINSTLPELFWLKLGTLDYRVRSRDLFKHCTKERVSQFSIKDFIFALLHCSDHFLRQDILEKMSECQLAVPIILTGVKGNKATFLIWSLRRIIKKWKEVNTSPLERLIVSVPLFTVSFLRIGHIKGTSKSMIINHLLGPHQGYRKHSYFLSKEDESCSSQFSQGCVEGAWYLPMNSNGAEKLKWGISIFNLRGDSVAYPEASAFACKSANLTFAFIAERNKGKLNADIKKIVSLATREYVVFISIDDEKEKPPDKGRRTLRWKDNWLFVRFIDLEELCNEVSAKISSFRNRCSERRLVSLNDLKDYCSSGIDVEDDKDSLQKACIAAKTICDSKSLKDLLVFKEQSFPLQSIWLGWVGIDQERIHPDGNSEKSVEILRDELKCKKDEKRREQLNCGLSQTMEKFKEALDSADENIEFFGYFASYLQEHLRRIEDENITEHLKNISKLEIQIKHLDELIKRRLTKDTANYDKELSEEAKAEDEQLRKERQDHRNRRQEEAETCRQKSIGFEHFLRELGQWYEAHDDLDGVTKHTSVLLLPGLAAKLLINGHSVEIMDGDTGRVPISWVSSVLRKLSGELGDPPILALSVIGVQSSGKSTLLNAMFGVRFPVRSGQCTRGLFLRVLRVDNDYVDKLGVAYIFLVDSEGIRSQERISQEYFRFDNELVTLALCISDVTLINIAGENVGPEMTGLLQIAAHALIRMKKVDLHSQCRILQQRVSDITADQRNKVNMAQIEDTLNKAISYAATKEGFEDRYQQFSDVFDLWHDSSGENLQYFPPLWCTGPMSPPNELYGHFVTKVKESILNELASKKVEPQFTVSSFRQRIRDVWTAVKDEKYLFNFQDSIKAMDFDALCMKLNEWIREMRLGLINELTDWQRRILDHDTSSMEFFETIKSELHDILNIKKGKLLDSFHDYVSQHQRKAFMGTHKTWFEQSLDVSITDIKSHLLSVLEIDVKTNMLQGDITSYVGNIRNDLRKAAKLEADHLRNQQKRNEDLNEHELDDVFESKWEMWLTDRENAFLPPVMSERALQATCEYILLFITKDMSVTSDINKLIKEGGIKTHSENEEWKDYFPTKGGAINVDEWFNSNQGSLQAIIDESIRSLQDTRMENKFDANIFQCILRSALQKLSSTRFTSEPPNLLKAKAMFYICGRLFNLSLKRQRLYESENSFKKLMEDEKDGLRQDFLAFIRCEDLLHGAIDCFRKLMLKACKNIFLQLMNTAILEWLLRILDANRGITTVTMNELCKQDKSSEYLAYIENQEVVSIKVINTIIADSLCQNIKGQSLLYAVVTRTLEFLKDMLMLAADSAEQKIKHDEDGHTKSFKAWVNTFGEAMQSQGFTLNLQEILSYDIHDLHAFTKRFQSFVKNDMDGIIMRQCKITERTNRVQIENVLARTGIRNNVLTYVTSGICFEQCPMCGAPCENVLPKGTQHGEHFSVTHLPRGLSGVQHRRTMRLSVDDCQTCVASSNETYTLRGVKKLCRDYKNDFPDWVIKPKGELLPRSKYWKWVMTTHNKALAKHYGCEPAKLPPSWRQISREEALASIGGIAVTFEMNLQVGNIIRNTKLGLKCI